MTKESFIGQIVKAVTMPIGNITDFDSIDLYFADGRVVTLTPVGDWGQEAWIIGSERKGAKKVATNGQ